MNCYNRVLAVLFIQGARGAEPSRFKIKQTVVAAAGGDTLNT